MQLSDLERDDLPRTVGKDGERQDHVHAERVGGRQASLLAHQDGIADRMLGGVLCHIRPLIDRDADNFESIFGMFALEAGEERDLAAAGLAPGGPEVHHEELAPIVREAVQDPVRRRQGDVGEGFGNPAAGRLGGRYGLRPRRRGRYPRQRLKGGLPRAPEVIDEKAAQGAQEEHTGERYGGDPAAGVGARGGAHEEASRAARVRAANASAFM